MYRNGERSRAFSHWKRLNFVFLLNAGERTRIHSVKDVQMLGKRTLTRHRDGCRCRRSAVMAKPRHRNSIDHDSARCWAPRLRLCLGMHEVVYVRWQTEANFVGERIGNGENLMRGKGNCER
ncbi:hypothetical protein DO71_5902 [Burkholderia pseudomallei]|nr:hypothetical protein DO71_5902 [Burkholderia pseudomallei]